jgi:hypothetical protein
VELSDSWFLESIPEIDSRNQEFKKPGSIPVSPNPKSKSNFCFSNRHGINQSKNHPTYQSELVS